MGTHGEASSSSVDYTENVLQFQKLTLHETGGAALPTVDLDPAMRHLLEENEGMLFEISTLRRELHSAQAEIARLKGGVGEKDKELEEMREKLGDAYTGARDASGKAINYRTECERLEAENIRLAAEHKRVCAELENNTNNIRNATNDLRCDSARSSSTPQFEQFQDEITQLLLLVDKFGTQLKRCAILTTAAPERVLEEVQKDFYSLSRLSDSVRRLSLVEETRVNEIRDTLVGKKGLAPPGDLAIIFRWMIVHAFTAGIVATEGNLRLIQTLISGTEGKGGNGGGERNADRTPSGPTRKNGNFTRR